ncbi:putative Glycerol-3-phosphate O-acyltransferase [uncultured Desulfobacterium sp.]|uniref:Glycerol-3-phosphate acyltransferase n=1 Tax=uncultured Desulfobacterium sp. TaxID=201089 RepID=A0A445N1J0_9BACT|nr:putative Glycerol-3-phosphate O-acyltransferase [uncultured Desulfobacterium sp.]
MNFSQNKGYYPSVLDHKPGFFLGTLLYSLFKNVQFAQDMSDTLRQLHRQGTVVYAIKFRGHFDYLLYHYRFRISRLPYPRIAFNMNMSWFLPLTYLLRVLKFQVSYILKKRQIPDPFENGFFSEAIQAGTSALMCLVDPKGFIQHFIHAKKDPLQFLIETQKRMEKPIFIVPQLIIYKKTPEKAEPNLADIFFGFKDNPGIIRKVALFFRHNRKAFIDFGNPVNLKSYLEGRTLERPMEEMSTEIRQMLVEAIDIQKRVIIGPVMKTRQQLKEIVLKDNDVRQAIEKTALRNKQDLKDIRKQADRIFDEIAADFNITYVQFFHLVLTRLWKKIYQGIDVDHAGLAVVRQWAGRGSMIYVPSHKSHIDYLVLNYILFEHHMHIPRIAAGQNLAFWPMGYIFKKCGAFFIRRTFKGLSLYPRIFSRYIKQLIREGHPLEFFIEGGRSRSGKLVLPKTGFLSILIQAFEEGFADDMMFIPVSISYDRILEEKSYEKELAGEKKQNENIKQILNARRFLKRKHGKIYIRFAQPVSLRQYLAQKSILPHAAVQPLAVDLIKSINRVAIVTPPALIASALLASHRRGFQIRELLVTVNILYNFISNENIPMADSLKNLEQTVTETLSVLFGRKLIDRIEDIDGKEAIYYLQEEKKRELEYYKNSIIHFFILNSFAAVGLLATRDEIKSRTAVFEDYIFLKNLFKNEFVYDNDKTIEEEYDKVIHYFYQSSYVSYTNDSDGYQLTRVGYDHLPVWAGFARSFIESYWIAVRSYLHMEKSGKKKSDLFGRMSELALKYHRHGVIEHTEGISVATLDNAIRYIRENVLVQKQSSDKDNSQANERLTALGRRLYALLHFS